MRDGVDCRLGGLGECDVRREFGGLPLELVLRRGEVCVGLLFGGVFGSGHEGADDGDVVEAQRGYESDEDG